MDSALDELPRVEAQPAIDDPTAGLARMDHFLFDTLVDEGAGRHLYCLVLSMFAVPGTPPWL